MMSSSCFGKKVRLSPDHESGSSCSDQNLSHSSNEQVITQEMCFFCFDVLHNYLFNKTFADPTFTNEAYPLFVTWKVGKEHRLRGCIGTFSPINLHEGLREYSITSSMKDSRFCPVKSDEVSKLHCAVSLLTHFEDCKNCFDWEVGVHGIRIEFTNDKGHHKTATYLPEVCVEQNWDQEETLKNLIRKAGYRGNVTPDFLSRIKTRRYRSEKMSVSYDDYAMARGLNGYASNHGRHHQHHPYNVNRKNSKEKSNVVQTNGYHKPSSKMGHHSSRNHFYKKP